MIKDNYQAKYGFWARQPSAGRLPKPVDLPPFPSRKFASYEEFNAWKRSCLIQIARQGGIQWSR